MLPTITAPADIVPAGGERRLNRHTVEETTIWDFEQWHECLCPDRSEHHHWVREGGTTDASFVRRWVEEHNVRIVVDADDRILFGGKIR